MNYNNNDIEKKLRQLENQSLPDLSKQDQHWQEMKKNLQVGSGSVRKNTLIKIGAILIVIAGITWLMFMVFHKRAATLETAAVTKEQKSPDPVDLKKDTVPSVVHYNSVDTSGAPVLTSNPPTDSGRIKKYPLLLKNSDIHLIDSRVSIDNFFDHLKKPAQEFLVNNNRDTIIKGRDGSAWLIPAGAFGNNTAVRIFAEEFYSYKDIITNRLVTCSDDKQLVTGGMIHLSAMVNNKEVNIQNGKSIRWFLPATSTPMNNMQLFTEAQRENWDNVGYVSGKDSGMSISPQQINWMPQQQYFTNTNKIVFNTLESGKPAVAKTAPIIINEKNKKDYSLSDTTDPASILVTNFATGDRDTIRKKMDTTYFVSTLVSPSSGRVFILQNQSLITTDLANRFNVDLQSLGWINCDRFYNDMRRRIDYSIDLGDDPFNYEVLIIFDNIKSMMRGHAQGNKMICNNVPEGEPVKVICVGRRAGKMVAAMQSVKISNITLTNLSFEETDAAQFKEKVSAIDK